MLKLNKNEQQILLTTLRQAFYFVLSLCFILSLRLIATIYQENTFREFGIIENIQLFLLSATAVSFLIQGILSKKFRPLSLFLSSLCAFAFCRELDSFFDMHVPFVSWKFCYLFPLASLFYIFLKRKKIKNQVFSFLTSPAFYGMCAAMFIFIPIAQAIGNRAFIASVLPDATDVILMRRFVEESCEILAYFILLISSIEFYISLIKNRK